MKLLDILVAKQDATWKYANFYVQDADCTIWGGKEKPTFQGCDWYDGNWIGCLDSRELADDYGTAIITKEMYDEAIKDKQEKPVVWDGNGFPPVGIICECAVGDYWHRVEVIGVNEERNVVWCSATCDGSFYTFSSEYFRPLKGEEQKQHDFIISEIAKVISDDTWSVPEELADKIYATFKSLQV